MPRLRSADLRPGDFPVTGTIREVADSALIDWDGVQLRVAPARTAWLLGRLACDSWLPLLDTLRPRRHVLERLADPDDPADLRDACLLVRGAYATVAGCPWWTARKLAASAVGNWQLLDGWAASLGTDLLELPLRRALALVRFRLMEGCKDKAEAERMDSDLATPGPSDAALDSQEIRAAEGQAFMAMLRAAGGGDPESGYS